MKGDARQMFNLIWLFSLMRLMVFGFKLMWYVGVFGFPLLIN